MTTFTLDHDKPITDMVNILKTAKLGDIVIGLASTWKKVTPDEKENSWVLVLE
jgi:hypothetical protein